MKERLRGRSLRSLAAIAGTCALAAGFASALAVPVRAADDTHVPRGGAGYFMIGGGRPDLGDLNAVLERSGYPRFPSSFLTMGGGGHAFIGRLVLGGEGQTLLERGNALAGWKTVLSGGCGFFDVGYIVHSGNALAVYPLIGIGAGSLNLKITGRETASFAEVLEDPGRSARLQKSGFLMQVALAADWWLGPARRNGRGGLFIGVRAGYVFAPAGGSWELEGREAAAGPAAGWTGPYLKMVIGAGGRAQ
jgi:hypothetical protein